MFPPKLSTGTRWGAPRPIPTMSRYKSAVFAAIHETASGLHRAGLLTDHEMREYDSACLNFPNHETPPPIGDMEKPKLLMCPWCATRFDPSDENRREEFCSQTCLTESEENQRELDEKRANRGID